MSDQIGERVCAVVFSSALRQLPVGLDDARDHHIGDLGLLDFVEELEDEFGLILDADTIGEMGTLREIRDYIAKCLALIHVN